MAAGSSTTWRPTTHRHWISCVYLRYMPSSAWSYHRRSTAATTARSLLNCSTSCPSAGPRTAYGPGGRRGVRRGLRLRDPAAYGPSVICALARLGGHPVAVVANQPSVKAGSIDAGAAERQPGSSWSPTPSISLGIVPVGQPRGDAGSGVGAGRHPPQGGTDVLGPDARDGAEVRDHAARKAYGFGSMVMGMIPYDGQSGVFAYPGATMGAMGASAMSKARGSDADEAAMLHDLEVQASFGSARRFGFWRLIDPREEAWNVLLHSLEQALYRRQGVPEPVARIGIVP
ncbi:MAG: carboxyl transferase domain-containing protein [Acidimicrobiales bacterium]